MIIVNPLGPPAPRGYPLSGVAAGGLRNGGNIGSEGRLKPPFEHLTICLQTHGRKYTASLLEMTK
jgi:hypothetical protein